METPSIAFATNVGGRDNMEDAFGAWMLHVHPSGEPIACLYVLDGVGGNEFGEEASYAARTVIASLIASGVTALMNDNLDRTALTEAIPDLLKDVLKAANEVIVDKAAADERLRHMATTAVVALVVNDTVFAAWAGDSRCYVYSRGRLIRISRDHSEVQRLIDQEKLSQAAARKHPSAHAIYRYLGRPQNFEAETVSCPLWPGDVVMLCSDGLTDVVADGEICSAMEQCWVGSTDLIDLPNALVRRALTAGTSDNVTVVCSRHQPNPAVLGNTRTNNYLAEVARRFLTPVKE